MIASEASNHCLVIFPVDLQLDELVTQSNTPNESFAAGVDDINCSIPPTTGSITLASLIVQCQRSLESRRMETLILIFFFQPLGYANSFEGAPRERQTVEGVESYNC
jgi:hypothetical protein